VEAAAGQDGVVVEAALQLAPLGQEDRAELGGHEFNLVTGTLWWGGEEGSGEPLHAGLLGVELAGLAPGGEARVVGGRKVPEGEAVPVAAHVAVAAARLLVADVDGRGSVIVAAAGGVAGQPAGGGGVVAGEDDPQGLVLSADVQAGQNVAV